MKNERYGRRRHHVAGTRRLDRGAAIAYRGRVARGHDRSRCANTFKSAVTFKLIPSHLLACPPELSTRIPQRIASLTLTVTTAGGRPWSNFPPVRSSECSCHDVYPYAYYLPLRRVRSGKDYRPF